MVRLVAIRWPILFSYHALAMQQFGRFLSVGFINSAVGYAVIFLSMYLTDLEPEVCNIAGYAVGFFISFALNRHYTFRSEGRISREFLKFALVFCFSYLINIMALTSLVRVLHVNAYASQLAAGLLYISMSYALNKSLVFSKT